MSFKASAFSLRLKKANGVLKISFESYIEVTGWKCDLKIANTQLSLAALFPSRDLQKTSYMKQQNVVMICILYFKSNIFIKKQVGKNILACGTDYIKSNHFFLFLSTQIYWLLF